MDIMLLHIKFCCVYSPVSVHMANLWHLLWLPSLIQANSHAEAEIIAHGLDQTLLLLAFRIVNRRGY